MHPSHPSDANGSVDMSPPGSRRGGPPPLSLESLDDRLTTVERTLEESGESSLPAELERIRRIAAEQGATLKEVLAQSKANGEALAKVTEELGEDPQLSTGKAGKGMRKQLSDLVDKQRAPVILQYITPVVGVLFAFYQALKLIGVLK